MLQAGVDATKELPGIACTGLFFIATLTLPLALCATEIRVSLLDDDEVLIDTARLLVQNGCSDESVWGFVEAVRYHKPDLLDTSRLPKKTSGFYHFSNVQELNKAFPDIFCEKSATNRAPDETISWSELPNNSLVCLDLVVLLTKDSGAKAPNLKEDFADKCFAKSEIRGSKEKPDCVVNPVTLYSFYQDGRTLLSPSNCYAHITGLERTESEVNLGISLKGERLLQGKLVDTDRGIRQLFATWNALRKRDGLEFPRTVKIVTVGYVPMHFRYWAINHVGIYMTSVDKKLSFERNGALAGQVKLVYLEKNGSRGPYLRVDFNDENEIAEFAAEKLLPDSRDAKGIMHQAPVYVSVNERLIRIARP